MVRVAGEDLLGPVKLLEQHAARQQMRPGHRPERHDRIGARDDRGAEPLRAADREGERTGAAVAPARETVGESAAGPGGAALVERNEPGAGRQPGKD